MSVGTTYWEQEIFLCEDHALSVRAKPNWTAEKISKFSNLRLSSVNKREPQRYYIAVCQAPQLSEKCRRTPLGNLSFEALEAWPECCVNRNLLIAFFNDKRVVVFTR
jgi:hypothetical protein